MNDGLEDSEAPRDIEAVRASVLRKLLDLRGMARRCREPICRRARRCLGRDFRCLRDYPPRPVSEEEAARRRAFINRAIKRRLAELEP